MIVVVYGCRPDAIKLGPVVAELRTRGVTPDLICTGQHTTLLRGTPVETDLADARSLGLVSSGSVIPWCHRATRCLTKEFDKRKPSLVVVQGDTMTAVAAARAADRLGIPIAHVEAGLRSHNLSEPWPEEGFRREITRMAAWHYAPTPWSVRNLRLENVPDDHIILTGNPIVSALARYTPARRASPPEPTILLTMHRREWLLGDHFVETIQALGEETEARPHISFVWPIHPAVEARIDPRTVWPKNMLVTGHMSYVQLIAGLVTCVGVMTDSGGLQEEAATLGVPCAVMRNVTDRPESVDSGQAQVFSPTQTGIHAAVSTLLTGRLRREPSDCFGDITAAATIAAHLAQIPQGN